MTKGDEVSKIVRLLDSEVVQRWAATVATIGFSLAVLPSRVGQAAEHPSVWNWVVVVVVVGGIVSFAVNAVAMWRKRLARGTKPDHTFVAPEDVPFLDVESAIESTTDRISAIKALREQHRGLGLKAAADLVDAALDERSE
ncbi:hypothetical protein R4P64_16690 [Rhodococcus sp. IEGM 1366]|uniref:hypothetical protein n=1 Tax=Rhodococcus sp. IEGM 1366 TaxID=3082223 RepID=UPI0029534E24|nr:hypothetical protein [Rhodococcus sp. IEGM 1366]MDV8068152.1 hypothetical protein [Rhodococcus sp. IEGM 1366]